MKFTALVRMRLILGVLSGILIYGQKFLAELMQVASVGREHTDFRPELQALDGVLLLAALTIFIFSFVRISRVGNDLCYDPGNPYWKLMKGLYGDSWKDSMSLCKSYWMTVWMIFLPAVLVTLLSLFAIFAIPAMLHDLAGRTWQEIFMWIGIFTGTAIVGVGLVFLIGWMAEKLKWFKHMVSALLIAGMVVSTIAIQIYSIHQERKIAIASAAWIYSGWAGSIVGCAGLAIFLIWAAFKFLPSLANSWIGRIFAAFKEKMCPVLIACPCGAQANLDEAENA